MVGIYARVSTEEQAKSGFSLQDQIRECRKKAGTDKIREYIDEGVSGEFLDRPALAQLRQNVRDGLISKIICFDPDRLSRKLMNQLLITDEFENRGVELLFVNGEYAKTPEGTLFYSMRGAIAEFEKAKINERMSRGRREKARQGRVLRDFQIYGYDYDQTTEKMVINEAEAELVRLIFALFTKPNDKVQGINGIARYLTERGYPTKRGASVWHRQVVRQMLSNRAYIGEFYQNRWNTEGMLGNKHKAPKDRRPIQLRPTAEWIFLPCPAIVENDTFDHAQQLLTESRRRWAGRSVHDYLLSGLVRCGECANTMTGRRVKHWGKFVYQYTDRKNSIGAKQAGCGRNIVCDDLEQLVWNQVRAWLCDEEEIEAAVQTEEVEKRQAAELRTPELLEKELEKTKMGRKRVLRLLLEGSVTEEEVRETLEELKGRETRLIQQVKELHALDHCSDFDNPSFLKQAVDYYLITAPEKLAFFDKRELLRRIIREVKVYHDKVEIYLF